MTRASANPLRAIAGSPAFQTAIIAVIVLNAIVVGISTYDDLVADHGGLISWIERGFVAVFTVEILIRIGAQGSRPLGFFRNGWNVFDFAVVAAAFLPGLSSSAVLLRIVRVLRVARLISMVPDLRVIVRGLGRSLTPMAGVAVLTLIIMYIYAIIGWALFGGELPERWGDAGTAMLTVFELLTLEGWNDTFAEARTVTGWAVPYFVSFILLGTFVVLNIVIAVVINSVEEARRLEARREAERIGQVAHASDLMTNVAQLRTNLDELEAQLAALGPLADPPPRPPEP